MSGHTAWKKVRQRIPRDQVPDDYLVCSTDCSRYELKHTLEWGKCELAVEPPLADPEFGYWKVFTASDGERSIGMANIPFLVVFPWAVHLPVGERHLMLDEIAESDNPAQCLEEWRKTAEVWEQDPESCKHLANLSSGDHGPVSRPEDPDELISTQEVAL